MHPPFKQIVSRGIRIPADERIVTPFVAKKLAREFYESQEILGLSKFVSSADRVLELGAGIGYVSTFLSKQLNVSFVTAVEANPVLCDFILSVHRANEVSNATVINGVALSGSAIATEDETCDFYVADPFWSSSLTRRRKRIVKEIKVPTIRLHDLVRQAEPTVIVCDIEGGEVELFEEVDLPGVRYVYMELHTRVTGGQGIRSVFESMHRAGFFYNQKVSNGDVVLFESLHQS